jgi:hypothetical protein
VEHQQVFCWEKTTHNGGCLGTIARQLHRWGCADTFKWGSCTIPATHKVHTTPQKKQRPTCHSTPLTQLQPDQEIPLVCIQRNVQRNCPPPTPAQAKAPASVHSHMLAEKQPARLPKATHSNPQHTPSTPSPGIQDTTVQGRQPRAWKILQLAAWQQHQHRKGTMRPIYTTVCIPL